MPHDDTDPRDVISGLRSAAIAAPGEAARMESRLKAALDVATAATDLAEARNAPDHTIRALREMIHNLSMETT